MTDRANLDDRCVNTLRFLAIDAIQKANSGHPGMPMGAAPMAYVLWTRFLRHNPANPEWFDRDRFVLSAGHGSMLLYALLHVTGYELSMGHLQRFRQWRSITPGHPERLHTPGIEVTTGPLGQGFGNGVGMAIIEKHLAARFNREGHDVIDHFTYAICSDGDIMEGVAAESASLAGHLRLGKLVYLYDANRTTLAASTDLTLTEDVRKRFEAYRWHVQNVDDGNDLSAIGEAIEQAQKEEDRPSLIMVRTHLGYGSPNMQDTFDVHGKPLGADEVRKTKENLGWPVDREFYVPDDVRERFRAATEKGARAESNWISRFEGYARAYRDDARTLKTMINGCLPDKWDREIPSFTPDDGPIATRSASSKVINAIAPALAGLIGGSADLEPSTKTVMRGLGDFMPPDLPNPDTQGSSGGGWNWTGRNLHFGVREHAMGAIVNGIGAHGGAIPFASTFLIFSDYMRPTIRLAALMKLGVIYVFTHDSIGVGEDGPTHQPVEQIASLRAIPGLAVIRPADANETAVAWQVAVETTNRPVALILSRQNLPVLDRGRLASAEGVRRGAYVLSEASSGKADLILIGTGSEVSLVIDAQERLEADGVKTRVVSMPSWELFERQPDEYRESVLPDGAHCRLAVEAGTPMGWERWIGARGDMVGVETFGSSAPSKKVIDELGFNVENICRRAKRLLDK